MKAVSVIAPDDLSEQLQLISELHALAKVDLLAQVPLGAKNYPIYSITLSQCSDPYAPTLALIGGVHGLETIGTRVILSYIRMLNQYLSWDESLHEVLKKIRLVFLPQLNPVGAFLRQRSNGNGVDLMRNGPLESDEPVSKLHIYRGHRIGSFLPWYRGEENSPMQRESRTLIEFVEREVFPARLGICVDVHSGFGAMDRLWFPYARKRGLFPEIAQMMAIKELLDATLSNHFYRVEPQSKSYTVHGDLWDFIYERHRELHPEKIFLPLTLEMGSWSWLKKNPLQILNRYGIFHPITEPRTRQVLRRHSPLFDFLARATASSANWLPADMENEELLKKRAARLWPF